MQKAAHFRGKSRARSNLRTTAKRSGEAKILLLTRKLDNSNAIFKRAVLCTLKWSFISKCWKRSTYFLYQLNRKGRPWVPWGTQLFYFPKKSIKYDLVSLFMAQYRHLYDCSNFEHDRGTWQFIVGPLNCFVYRKPGVGQGMGLKIIDFVINWSWREKKNHTVAGHYEECVRF